MITWALATVLIFSMKYKMLKDNVDLMGTFLITGIFDLAIISIISVLVYSLFK